MNIGKSPKHSKHEDSGFYWVAVQELKLSYHNPETMLCTIYPDYEN